MTKTKRTKGQQIIYKTLQKIKVPTTRTPQKTVVELMFSCRMGRVN